MAMNTVNKLWAKSDPRYSLWKHLLDTAAVSLALPNPVARFGWTDEQTALLVGLHDIGEADASFQYRNCSAVSPGSADDRPGRGHRRDGTGAEKTGTGSSQRPSRLCGGNARFCGTGQPVTQYRAGEFSQELVDARFSRIGRICRIAASNPLDNVSAPLRFASCSSPPGNRRRTLLFVMRASCGSTDRIRGRPCVCTDSNDADLVPQPRKLARAKQKSGGHKKK